MAVNEFQALDGVDPNEIYSGDEETNGNGDKVNFESSGSDLENDGSFPPLPALPVLPSQEDINTADPESFTMPKSKERSPASMQPLPQWLALACCQLDHALRSMQWHSQSLNPQSMTNVQPGSQASRLAREMIVIATVR